MKRYIAILFASLLGISVSASCSEQTTERLDADRTLDETVLPIEEEVPVATEEAVQETLDEDVIVEEAPPVDMDEATEEGTAK